MGAPSQSKVRSTNHKPKRIIVRQSNGNGHAESGIVQSVDPIVMGDHPHPSLTFQQHIRQVTAPEPWLTDAVPPETAVDGVNFWHPCAGKIRITDHDKGLIQEFCPDGVTPRKKVAIVGYAETSRMLAPFDDPEWSIWGMNQLYRHIPRADRWFDIHHNWNEHVVEGTDHVGWLSNAKIPCYMVERLPQFQNSVTLPIQRLIDINGKDYFSSSIAYMIALAIADGFTHLRIFGVDLIVGDEWDYQKPNAEFWIGV